MPRNRFGDLRKSCPIYSKKLFYLKKLFIYESHGLGIHQSLVLVSRVISTRWYVDDDAGRQCDGSSCPSTILPHHRRSPPFVAKQAVELINLKKPGARRVFGLELAPAAGAATRWDGNLPAVSDEDRETQKAFRRTALTTSDTLARIDGANTNDHR